MKHDDMTDMGGTGEAFLTTHWSVIENIGESDEDRSRALIGSLLRKYWKPVYCYLRRKGYDNEQAKDLTQGFFHDVVLGRSLIQKADQSKGRFRSFLLIALNRYLITAKTGQAAQKRIPKSKLISLDVKDLPELRQTASELTPEDSFNYAWVSALLEQVLTEVEAKCHEDGKTVHWHVFHDRVLDPIMEKTDPPSMKEICRKYAIESEATASNMMVTVKRRFQTALRNHLRGLVVSEEKIDEELAEIMRFLPKMAQDGA
ncbi:MAG: RNA polymerase sigma factor [Planctomycetota bacterium]|jgi:RNA polymerase sigma-70 factor (ECF subfamily)